MIIDTPDGPKFEWEVDEETVAAAIAATATSAEEAREQIAARQLARDEARAQLERQAATREVPTASKERTSQPSIIDPDIVPLAEKGDTVLLDERLRAGCSPDVVAFEFDVFPGGARMYCNDWTPLSAAAAAGKTAAVRLLLEARADADVVCCACNSSGAYRFWTALDCARTGDTVPFERDPERQRQPRHPEVEQLLLAAGARPSSALPEPPCINTYGYSSVDAPRPNPCLDAQGMPLRPAHLFDPAEEAERRKHPGQPKFGLGSGGSGCPMTSMGLPRGERPARRERVYTGGSRVYK